jgi:hypothetical protein
LLNEIGAPFLATHVAALDAPSPKLRSLQAFNAIENQSIASNVVLFSLDMVWPKPLATRLSDANSPGLSAVLGLPWLGTAMVPL